MTGPVSHKSPAPTFEVAVPKHVLERLLAWGDQVVDFQPDHALDSLFIAAGFFDPADDPADGRADDNLFLLGLMICFSFWIDDRVDRYLGDAESPIDWESTLDFARQRPFRDCPEVAFLREISSGLRDRARG